MTSSNYVFRPIGMGHNGLDLRPQAKVLMNAVEDLQRDDPEALNGYLCLEIMRLGYSQRIAVEDVMEPERNVLTARRLGAQICEACVMFWDCKERVMTPMHQDER